MGESVHTDHKHKPLLITILTLYHGLFGLLAIISAITLLFDPTASNRFQNIIERLSEIFSSLTNELLGIFFLITGLIAFAICWAFWTLKPWARLLAFVMVLINIIIEILIFDWLDLLFSSVVLICLFLPSVRAAFQLQSFIFENNK